MENQSKSFKCQIGGSIAEKYPETPIFQLYCVECGAIFTTNIKDIKCPYEKYLRK